MGRDFPILKYWSTGVLEYWSDGVLEYWDIGTTPSLKYANTPWTI
jgi:hypothetical protein